MPKMVLHITTEANVMKLYKKMKDKYVCHARDLGSYAQSQGHNHVTGQTCISAITQKILKQM